MHNFKIGQRTVGFKDALHFIADIAANHDGNLDQADKLIELAKEAGVRG
jgi:sialic acid synthase SpsE